ncbi:MAG: NAD-dependent epimerase/dehydratase family protein [Bacteroidia bacterium]
MKVAITGATGHIGANLTRQLLEKGISPRILGRNDLRAVEGLDVEVISGDIMDPASIDRLVAGAEVVFHLAAKISITGDPDGSVFHTNVEGPQHVVNACLKAGVRRLVHFSSIHAFQQSPIDEALNESRTKTGPEGFAYDRSKAAGEEVVRKAVASGLEVIILNPTSVIGPYDFKPSFLGSGLWDIYHHKVPALLRGGFDWVDARDVAAAAIQAMEKGKSGEQYLLSGQWRSLAEIADILCNLYNRRAPRVVLPHIFAQAGLPFLQAFTALTGSPPLFTKESLAALRTGNLLISNQKAREDLSFNPGPIEDTLKTAMDWMLKNHI